MAAIGRLSKSHRRAESIRGKRKVERGKGGDPSLKRGKRGGRRKESPRDHHLSLRSLSPSRGLQGWRPNRWANFFAAQFNEASLNSLPGAADRSRGTNGRRAAGGFAGVGRDEDGGKEGATLHRRRFVNRPLATLQCGRKVRERRFHWPARSRPCA